MYRPLIFCLFFTSVLQLSTCSCIRITKPYNGRKIFFCYNSKDFKTDLKKAPVEETQNLHFEFADLPKLENNFLEILPNLQDVNLNYCNIREIEDGAFHGLKDLTDLDLSDNDIKHVKGSWFKQLKLKKLSLANNRIETIDEAFSETIMGMGQEYTVIILKFNNLKTLPTNFGVLLEEGFVDPEYNPWSYKTGLVIATIIDTTYETQLASHNVTTQLERFYSYPGPTEIQLASHNASRTCNSSLGMDVSDDIFDNCVTAILTEQLKPQLSKSA